MRPHRQQPTRLPRSWDSPGKNTGVGCHFLLQCRKVRSESEVAQLCLTLSDPMECSPLGSSVHGIFQARVLEWGAIAGSSGFSKSSLNIWKFTVHILLKPGLENFEHYFASSHLIWVRWVQLCGSLIILWHCLSLGLEWKLTFISPVATAEFFKFTGMLSAALWQYHFLGFEIAQLEFHHFH